MSSPTHSDGANRRLVLDLIAHLDSGDIDALDALLHDEFVTHNARVPHDPAVMSGRQAFVEFLRGPVGRQMQSGTAEVKRVLSDADCVAVHLHVTTPHGPDLATVDIFRVKDGLVAEHWDVVQPIAEQAHPHGPF